MKLCEIPPFNIAAADLYDPLRDWSDVMIAVPFAMNRNGTEQSAQGRAVVDALLGLYQRDRSAATVASGGHHVKGHRLTEAVWTAKRLRCGGVPSEQIVKEGASIDTRGNAVETLTLLQERLLRNRPLRIVLVVNCLQAKRALKTFRKYAKERDWQMTFQAFPVQDPVWNDNAKVTLRHPVVFALRELLLAWPLFFFKGYV